MKRSSISFTGFTVITKLPWDPNPSEEEHNVAARETEILISIEREKEMKRSSISFTGFPVITKLPWDPTPSEEEHNVAARETEIVISIEREKEMKRSSFPFTGFPVITKLPWDPTPSEVETEREIGEIPSEAVDRKRERLKKKFRSGDSSLGENVVTTVKVKEKDTSSKEKISFFIGFPTTITKFPWELTPTKKYVPSPHRPWPVPKKSYPWWPVPSLDGYVDTVDPSGHIIRTPYIEYDDTNPPPPPTIVEFNPNEYPYTWKPEIRDCYYAQLNDSEGFDVDPIPGVHMYGLVVPMDHLGAEKKQCELVARMAVDEYNRRYKDDKGELKFGKIIKVMVKVVGGFIYYSTVEAINLSSEMPVTFQAVVFTGVSKDVVKSFRFISDSKKEPWLWEDDICSK